MSSGAQDVPGAALQLTLPAPQRCLKDQKDILMRAIEQGGFVILLMDLEQAESLFRDRLSRSYEFRSLLEKSALATATENNQQPQSRIRSVLSLRYGIRWAAGRR